MPLQAAPGGAPLSSSALVTVDHKKISAIRRPRPGDHRAIIVHARNTGRSSRTSGHHRCKRPFCQGRPAQRRRSIQRAARAAL
jgi:hypothetical protein